MTDFNDFFPLVSRTEDEIRTDWNTRANAGLSPGDPDWVDTREGSMFWLATQMAVIEQAAQYDRMNELVAAAILSTSWGTWLDLHAASFGEERIPASSAIGVVTFSGASGTLIATGTAVGITQTDPDAETPTFRTTASGTIPGVTTGTLDLAVIADVAGADGNVAAGDIDLPITAVSGLTSVTNAASFASGADVETDADLKKRLIGLFSGKGSGTIGAYTREVLKWPGIGAVVVTPNSPVAGAVKVVVLDDDRNPVAPAVVTDLQDHLDPTATPGIGAGWAPINHTVTVSTPTAQPIYVTATVSFLSGYSLDGTSGSIALRSAITKQITDYIDVLNADDDVIYNHVMAQFFKVKGVLNVSLLKVGTSASPSGVVDVAISSTTVAQPAVSGPVVLS